MYQGNPNVPQGAGMPMQMNRNPSMPYDNTGYYNNYQQQQMQQQPPQHAYMAAQAHHPLNAPRDDSQQKLKRLDEINLSIGKISLLLMQFFEELTKDKQQQAKMKQTKTMFEEFLKHLKKVESDLLQEISLLGMASTGHPHEGSIYGARKDFDLARMQVHLIGAQLGSLRESLNKPVTTVDSDEEEDEDEIEVTKVNGVNGHHSN